MPPEPTSDVDPRFADAVRRAYVRPIDGATAARQAAMLAAAARDTAPAPRPRRSRRLVLRPVLAAGLAVLALPAALAVAGVDLPGAIDAPYTAVGIKLPHQQGTTAARPSPRRALPRPRPPVTAAPTPVPPRTAQAERRHAHPSTPRRTRRRPQSARRAGPPAAVQQRTPQRRATPNRPPTAGQKKPHPQPRPAPNPHRATPPKQHRNSKPATPPGQERKQQKQPPATLPEQANGNGRQP